METIFVDDDFLELQRLRARAEAAERRADRWEHWARRLWFFGVSIVPVEWIDDTIAALMKRANKQ